MSAAVAMPAPSASGHAIPTIDIAPLLGGGAGAPAVIEAIGRATETYGFMSLVGHGVSAAVVDETLRAGAEFFAWPLERKLEVQERRTNRGFQPMFDNMYPGQKPSGQEAFSMGHPDRPSDPALLALPFYAETPWPDLPGFREALEACYRELFQLGRHVLAALATHLGAPADFFEQRSRNTYSNMRVNHYPPIETLSHITDIGVRPHEDQGLVTLLIQDMNGGLEVGGPNGEWLPVLPNRDAVVVNVAKLMTRWTNGRYKSALHKVINRSGRERYSIPLFVHPDFHQVIDARDLVGEQDKMLFEPFVAGQRVYENFAKQRVSWQEAAKAT